MQYVIMAVVIVAAVIAVAANVWADRNEARAYEVKE